MYFKQGVLTQIGSAKLGRPELANLEVQYLGRTGKMENVTGDVYYDGQHIGSHIIIGQDVIPYGLDAAMLVEED